MEEEIDWRQKYLDAKQEMVEMEKVAKSGYDQAWGMLQVAMLREKELLRQIEQLKAGA